MSPRLLSFVKDVGVPAALALMLGYLLWQQGVDARSERETHTVLLIDRMTALREACNNHK